MRTQGTHINVIKKEKINFAAFLVACLLIFSALYLLYGNHTTSASEEIETVHLFPSNIVSEVWVNTNTLFSQDLNDDAIFGEFNPSNSAFMQISFEVSEEGSTSTVDILSEINETQLQEEKVLEETYINPTTTEEFVEELDY